MELKIKHRQAEIVLTLIKNKTPEKKLARILGLSDADFEEKLYLEIKRLNKCGK